MQALHEGEGELWPPASAAAAGDDVSGPGDDESGDAGDETSPDRAALASVGPLLVGFEGYSCVSCHPWKGKALAQVEPSAVGPDLTTATRRLKKEWFLRWLDDPQRFLPGVAMPSFFPREHSRASIDLLDRDPARQKEAIWQYLSLGTNAPAPTQEPPLELPPPRAGPPRVAQIPLRIKNDRVEAIVVQFVGGDVLVYDVEHLQLRGWWSRAQLLRHAPGWRTWELRGEPVSQRFAKAFPLELGGGLASALGNSASLASPHRFLGFDALPEGVRLRSRLRWRRNAESSDVRVDTKFQDTEFLDTEVHETLRLVPSERRLERRLELRGVGDSAECFVRDDVPTGASVDDWAVPFGTGGSSRRTIVGGVVRSPMESRRGMAHIELRYRNATVLEPPTGDEPPPNRVTSVPSRPLSAPPDSQRSEPASGYRATPMPLPADHLLMPSALAVDPESGDLFVASIQRGKIFRYVGARHSMAKAEIVECAGPLQEIYGMAHDGRDLFVLHRRNLSRLTGSAASGTYSLERLVTWPQGLMSSYDWGYGLVRRKDGSFFFGLAPWANRTQRGAGNVLQWQGTGPPKEIAYGLRNPVGWCADADGELFVTDNQGEWVATNRLCHIVEERFYGFPNPKQPQHRSRPQGPTAVWVPYRWARSINGVACDTTGGKFGPFAGQFFLAELMAGGAIVRAQLERVEGEYQGACFPFWGRGLLGPLTIAFDPEGPMYVGSITEPSWMGQPDNGRLFRLDYLGPTGFAFHSIAARPRGFSLRFTQELEAMSTMQTTSFDVAHYRYDYGPEYGSPERDRTVVLVRGVRRHADGFGVDLDLGGLVAGRIYSIRARELRAADGEKLAPDEGVYTLNRVPSE